MSDYNPEAIDLHDNSQLLREAVARIAHIEPNPSRRSPGAMVVEVRCPCCGELHGHGLTGGDALLGVALHRISEVCGSGYIFSPTISLYTAFETGRLVGLWLGEKRL